MPTAYLNRIATAVPSFDVHEAFVRYAGTLLTERRLRALFERMAERSQIVHRWSCLEPAEESAAAIDVDGFYARGAFPSTRARMQRYEREAPRVAQRAVTGLGLGNAARDVTHLIVTSCTGFSAPGIDIEIVKSCGLRPSVERTLVGFMGCYAAISALKLARHIVRSEPRAKVLVVSLELCTLHMQETPDLEQVLTFLLFGDGCAAALVSAEPEGLALDSFYTVLLPTAADQITWNIGDRGFDMFLSGRVPHAVAAALQGEKETVLAGAEPGAIGLWAVHPGGRSILDAVEGAFALDPLKLAESRGVLRDFGNMSSATVLFVLAELMRGTKTGAGCAMAFGPGLTAETMLFRKAV
jgi:predicted naringenin-chalcone synthase